METNIEKELLVTLTTLFQQFNKVLLISVGRVGSSQLKKIRKDLRGNGVIVICKKTTLREIIKLEFPQLDCFLPHIHDGVHPYGLLFTNSEIKEIRTIINSHPVFCY